MSTKIYWDTKTNSNENQSRHITLHSGLGTFGEITTTMNGFKALIILLKTYL